jgi:hypothetical protein
LQHVIEIGAVTSIWSELSSGSPQQGGKQAESTVLNMFSNQRDPSIYKEKDSEKSRLIITCPSQEKDSEKSRLIITCPSQEIKNSKQSNAARSTLCGGPK